MAKDNQTYREDEGSPNERYPSGQIKQATGADLAPADGANGFVGSETGPALGMTTIEGKKGSVENRPVTSIQRSTGEDQDTAAPSPLRFEGQDSTDENASYKHPQTDEGLLQTYRDSRGAGDAGPAGSDEPDQTGVFGGDRSNEGHPDTQKIGSEMPQTVFTDEEGGGAPKFKHAG